MVSAPRRTSSRHQRIEKTELEVQVTSRKRQRKSSNPSPPSKRQKTNGPDFEFHDESSEEETASVRRSKRTPIKSEHRNDSRMTRNEDTPTKSMTNGTGRKRKRESNSPVASDTSSDPLTSARFTTTHSRRSMQTPINSPASKNAANANGTVTPTGGPPIKSFKQRIEEVTVSAKKDHQKKKDGTRSSKVIRFDGTPQKTTSIIKPPTPDELDDIKFTILNKLIGRALVPLKGKPAEVAEEIHSIMVRAVQGESNTLLLLGGPGSSKSTIVNTALNKLKDTYPDKGSYYTIRLDGQIQTDDKIALREIARQLALEMDVEMEKVHCTLMKLM